MRNRSSSFKLRQQVFERDAGVCATCGADCEKIKRVYWAILDFDAQVVYAKILRVTDQGRTFWDADHIQEVAENGSDSLRNLQTLCVNCHIQKTREWQISRTRISLPQTMAIECRRPESVAPRRPSNAEIAAGDWNHPYYHYDRTQLIIDYVNRWIAVQVAERGDWPKAMEPIESDQYGEMILY